MLQARSRHRTVVYKNRYLIHIGGAIQWARPSPFVYLLDVQQQSNGTLLFKWVTGTPAVIRSGGAIAGIAIGAVVVLAAVGYLVVRLYRRRRIARTRGTRTDSVLAAPLIDLVHSADPLDSSHCQNPRTDRVQLGPDPLHYLPGDVRPGTGSAADVPAALAPAGPERTVDRLYLPGATVEATINRLFLPGAVVASGDAGRRDAGSRAAAAADEPTMEQPYLYLPDDVEREAR
ncbi:hypothetical protein GGF32_001683 [Allomyces javanicus]|nr:hypothetical protein GGF32_001683 [Allomyces javanicus]